MDKSIMYLMGLLLSLSVCSVKQSSAESCDLVCQADQYYQKAKSNNDTVEQIRLYEKAITLNPDHNNARYNVAVLYAETKPTKALIYYDILLEKNPKDWEVYLLSANILLQKSRIEDAYRKLSSAMRVCKHISECEQALPAIRKNLKKMEKTFFAGTLPHKNITEEYMNNLLSQNTKEGVRGESVYGAEETNKKIIEFRKNETELDYNAKKEILDQIVAGINRFPDLRNQIYIYLTGYADHEYEDLGYAKKRSRVIQHYLVDNAGIKNNHFIIKNYVDKNSAQENKTIFNIQHNHIAVIELLRKK